MLLLCTLQTPTTMNSSVTKLYERSLDKSKKSGERLVWKPLSMTPAAPLEKPSSAPQKKRKCCCRHSDDSVEPTYKHHRKKSRKISGQYRFIGKYV